jgi:hypothetical protein
MQKLYATLPHPGSAGFELRYLYCCGLGRCIHQKDVSRHPDRKLGLLPERKRPYGLYLRDHEQSHPHDCQNGRRVDTIGDLN